MRPVAGVPVAAAIHRAADGNPLLTIGLEPGTDPPSSLLAPGRLVAEVGDWVGTRERRVAASLVLLGYSARLVGPVLASALTEDLLLDVRPVNVHYGFSPGSGFRLSLGRPAGWLGAPPGLLAEHLVGHLAAVIDAVRAVAPVAAGLMWGNVASSVAGTLRALAGTVPAGTRYTFGRSLLAHGPLAGTGELATTGGFRRRSCCLYYRLDGGGTCGDCPLPPTAARYRRE